MIDIDPRLFLFIVEFLCIFFILTIFLLRKYLKKSGGGGGDLSREDFEKYLEDWLKKLQGELENYKGDSQKDNNIEAMTDKEILLIRLQFLETAYHGFRRCEGDFKIFWEHIFNHFTELLKNQLLRIKKLEQELKSVPKAAPAAAPVMDDMAQIDDDMEMQTVEIAASSEEVDDLKKKIAAMEKENQEAQAMKAEMDKVKEEYSNLKERYDELDMEYINLYKEHKGETGWATAMKDEE